eukprot:3479545-Amphidinium_carterae.2
MISNLWWTTCLDAAGPAITARLHAGKKCNGEALRNFQAEAANLKDEYKSGPSTCLAHVQDESEPTCKMDPKSDSLHAPSWFYKCVSVRTFNVARSIRQKQVVRGKEQTQRSKAGLHTRA